MRYGSSIVNNGKIVDVALARDKEAAEAFVQEQNEFILEYGGEYRWAVVEVRLVEDAD